LSVLWCKVGIMALPGEYTWPDGVSPSAGDGVLSEPAVAPDAVEPSRRFRGKNKQPAWRRDPGAPVAVIRLPLVVDDPHTRRRVQQLFWSMWQVKRAVQHDARSRVDAYWAGPHRRRRDAKGWRAELGLSREALERAAYAHLADSRWLGCHVTKALALHTADEVWTGVARHLFPDSSGRRFGRPRVGRWWDYTRIPGRARSHTTDRKWETFRLHGTLAGHLDTYRHPALPAELTPTAAAALPAGTSVLTQPRHLLVAAPPTRSRLPGKPTTAVRRSTRAASWWDHTGPLVVVFSGGPNSTDGELVLPVRLPQGAGRWRYLVHCLGRPEIWHKIDLVRRRDPGAPGGWAYEAHLMILDAGYASPATQARRAKAAAVERVGGMDGNVSNLAVVSFPASLDPADGPVTATRITPGDVDRAKLERDRRKARGRQRALDRSRRATNRDHYQLSKRQEKRAARRMAAGLPERTVEVPNGPREANAAGVPKRAYRNDWLSNGYRRARAGHAAAAASLAKAKAHRARTVAAQLVAVHGARLTVEDCDIRTWFRLWGSACAAFTPGMLLAAVGRECAAVPGGRLARASTRPTAWSQHCLCGAQVPKPLRERTHHCGACGLTGDRDLIAAAVGAFTRLADPADPATARVDYTSSRHAQVVFGRGLQEALSSQPCGSLTLRVGEPRQPTKAGRPLRGNGGPLLGEVPESAVCRPRMSLEPPPSGPGTTPERHARNPDYPLPSG